jgi:hypothetical protein
MVQYKSIIFITAMWMAVLFSGCIGGEQEGTPGTTPTVTATPFVTETPFPEATPIPVTPPKELPQGALYVNARMIKPAYWEKEKYELRSLQVQIYNQQYAPVSITAQIVSGELILEEKTFLLKSEGSSYSYANDRVHFINNTNVTLRLLIQGYQPVEYKFREVGSLS